MRTATEHKFWGDIQVVTGGDSRKDRKNGGFDTKKVEKSW